MGGQATEAVRTRLVGLDQHVVIVKVPVPITNIPAVTERNTRKPPVRSLVLTGPKPALTIAWVPHSTRYSPLT